MIEISKLQKERDEIEKKAKKLSQYIGFSAMFPLFDPSQQELMKEQNEIMWEYFEVLAKRINKLEK